MLRTPPSPDRVTPPDDPALVARVHDGDAEALATLFRRHAAWLHRVVRRVVDSDDEADDVVQELFVGLPEALAHYVERGALAAWLARVALRIALARRRRDRRREERAPGDADAHLFHGTTCPTDDTLLDRVALEAAVARLPEPLRHVVLLRIVAGCSHADVAATLGISEGAARVRLHRALHLLHRSLGPE